MEEKRNMYRLLVGTQRERECLEDQDICGWIILGWILERWNEVVWTELVWLWVGASGEVL
jgi:hypothetical protein